MEFQDKTVVITGGASGIGAALARMMVARGGRVAILDRKDALVRTASDAIGCMGLRCDVSVEAGVQACIREISETLGEIDIFVSNAGVFEGQSGHVASAPDDIWLRNWSVHVMAHVYAARALLPGMIARGSGYFVNVTSAAGLLNQIGDAAYSATKHAAVSFAESLAISHGDDGIGVSVVCPQYVATPLIGLGASDTKEHADLLTAEEVALSVIAGIERRQFLILPHPAVALYAQRRAEDHDRWIEGMRRLRAKSLSQLGASQVAELYRLV